MPVISGDLIRFTVSYSVPGSSVPNNVFYFQVTAGAPDDEVVDAAAEWANEEWGSAWESSATLTAQLTTIKVDVVDAAGLTLRNLGQEVINRSGDFISDTNAALVAAGIFAPTGRPKSRGRKAVPGFGSDRINGGLYDASAMATLTQLALVYVADIISGLGLVMTPGVLSTVLGTFIPFVGEAGFDDIPDSRITRKPDRGS